MSKDVHDFENVRLRRCGQRCYCWFLTPSLTTYCFLMSLRRGVSSGMSENFPGVLWTSGYMKRYEDTGALRDGSQHILDILEFDLLPDCSGSNWIHFEDISQNEGLGSLSIVSKKHLARRFTSPKRPLHGRDCARQLML